MAGLSLYDKVSESLDFIRKYEPSEGYFVAFSGGKDSIVLLDLVRKAGVKHKSYYSATGIDPPELCKFIRKNYPGIAWVHPEMNFYKGFFKYGIPTRQRRWCCDVLKKDATLKIPLRSRLVGIRVEESFKRRSRPRIDKLPKYIHYKAIFYWFEWEIWEYIEKNNLAYCELYDEGFHRLGCVICPFICGVSKYTRTGYCVELEQHMRKWPRHYNMFEIMVERWWDKKVIKQGKVERMAANNHKEFLDKWYKGLSLTKKDKKGLIYD